ncbi:MAG: LLM class flavin-dependent oxidoreductase [Gammaproteobacteria bacterium]|jgi:alkanesulfonate monooxygenase SsuD/methylene tetrahydromethanopterin reductase-like flavin-dependent oxidoreductase (luciferase family)
MQLGLIFTGGDLRVAQLAELATRAETNGFSMLAMAEAWRSAWVPLTAMAAVTRRIRLGPYVLNAYGRSPLLAGMAAVDFNEFSAGRLVLGVGGGNRIINEQWQGTPHTRVLTKMREYVTLMQRIARTDAGERLCFKGEVHDMDWCPAVSPAAAPYPVVLAAVFPKMMRVAAQVADGIGAGATLSAGYVTDVLKPRAAAAANAIERDPAELDWTAVAVTAVAPDRERARRAAREAICHLYAPLPHPYYEYTMREQGFGAVVDRLLKLMPAGELERAVAAIPDECIDRLTIAGTLADCREQIAAYDGVVDTLLLLNAIGVENDDVDSAYGELLQLPLD